MKKLLILFITAITLFACSTPEYKITGVIDGAEDGDSVMLGYSSNGIDFTTVAKTTIENGEFVFNGKQDGCKIYYIGYETEEAPIYALFFLEPGEIKAEIAPDYSYITGTPMNDLNIQVEDSLESYVMKMLSLQDVLYRDSTMSEENYAEISNKNNLIQRQAMEYIQGVIRENIDNMVGLFLLAQYNDLFDDNELATLLAAVPEECQDSDNNPLYDILLEVQEYRNNPSTFDELMNSIDEEGDNISDETNTDIVE